MQKISHENRSHAVLSASSSNRWINCTPSARLEEKESVKTNNYAREGTLAHEIAENKIMQILSLKNSEECYKELLELRKHELYYEDMERELELYVNTVVELYKFYLKLEGSANIYIEHKTDFSHLVPEGFGTADIVITAGKKLEVIDLKFGRGIKVSAENNPQLMLYALGCINTLALEDIQDINLTIIQPRLFSISNWKVSLNDLVNWGNKIVYPAATKAFLGEGKQHAGDWCKWCKVSYKCRAFADMNLKSIKNDFLEPKFINKTEMIEIYKNKSSIINWLSQIENYILDEMQYGEDYSPLKLKEGRKYKQIVSESEIIKKLKELNIDESEYMEKKMLSASKIYAILEKKGHFMDLDKYIIEKRCSSSIKF